ncbi:Uncharacterized protein HZ326_13799 [Fusarium oxysporum f. sp. albedinis]|nr:Uncharacterized protein HZ326_13799 [Fusarium oxysporum f. sp. albedinis]
MMQRYRADHAQHYESVYRDLVSSLSRNVYPPSIQKEAMQDRQVRNPGYPALGSCRGPVMVGNKSAGGVL